MHSIIKSLDTSKKKYVYLCESCKNNKKMDLSGNMVAEIDNLEKLQKNNNSKLRRMESFTKTLKLT